MSILNISSQDVIKIAQKKINTYRDDTTLMAESEEKLKSLLMRVLEDGEKAGLKLNIQKTNMASSPITSWEIEGENLASKSLWTVSAAMKLKDICSLEGKL